MAFDYNRSQETAERLIKRFGQSATLQEFTNSGTAYDPDITTTEHACTVAVLNWRKDQIDGSLIRSTDKLLYLSTENLTITPGTENKIVVQGATYSITSVDTLSPAGTVVYYQINARA